MAQGFVRKTDSEQPWGEERIGRERETGDGVIADEEGGIVD